MLSDKPTTQPTSPQPRTVQPYPSPRTRARACVHACEPAQRTAAVAPVGLCPRRHHAPARGLLVKICQFMPKPCGLVLSREPVIPACPIPPNCNRSPGNPARLPATSHQATDGPATEQRPRRAPVGTRAAKNTALLLPGVLNWITVGKSSDQTLTSTDSAVVVGSGMQRCSAFSPSR